MRCGGITPVFNSNFSCRPLNACYEFHVHRDYTFQTRKVTPLSYPLVMIMFHIALPLIHHFSLKTQLLILFLLLLGSYLHRGARRAIAVLSTAYLAFKIIVPTCRLLFWLFKSVAMFGFYIHYFQIGLGFIVGGVMFILDDGLKWLERELGKQ